MKYGPENASLHVHTYREGVAAKVGHDLVIEVTRWEASFEDGAIALSADPASLEVREGHRGVKPLSDKDRREIVKTIDAKVLGREQIVFRSTSVDGEAVAGELTMAGATRPVTARLETAGGRICTTIPLVQSEWGIKPYRGLMGALKVRDDVEIVIDAPAA
jgi:polyisoprenoid-binding protein YceI